MISGEAVLELLSGDDTLLDAVLVEINMRCIAGSSVIDLRFNARPGSQFSSIVVRFLEITRFDIPFDFEDFPFDIWDLKFLKLNDSSFFITLDPDPSTLGAAGVKELTARDTDKFVIFANQIQAFVNYDSQKMKQ